MPFVTTYSQEIEVDLENETVTRTPLVSTKGQVYVPETPATPSPYRLSFDPPAPLVVPRSDVQTRNWCFTVNNYLQSDEGQLRVLAFHEDVSYLVFGREIAPTTGTPHLQCFIQFKKKKRFNYVREVLPVGSHIEPSKGSAFQGAEYCKTDGDFEEFVNLV